MTSWLGKRISYDQFRPGSSKAGSLNLASYVVLMRTDQSAPLGKQVIAHVFQSRPQDSGSKSYSDEMYSLL